MQTFLPYADFTASSAVLDDRRLGKQRVETFQILRALTWPRYAWKNHPAVSMWRGFVPALVAYGLANCREWSRRGYQDTVSRSLLEFTGGRTPSDEVLTAPGEVPPWLGLDLLHLSHQSSLVRKEPQWYRPYFPDVPDDLPYWWPPDVFPRWPVRAAGQPLSLDEALQVLGFEDVRAGQGQAASAAASGRDCVAVQRPGHGATSTGLLAGLMTPGRTLWVHPTGGPRGAHERPENLEAVPSRGPVTRSAPTAGPVARSPSPDDLAAMAAESLPAEWVFTDPARVAEQTRTLRDAPPGLIVLDRASELTAAEHAVVVDRADTLARPPILALTGPLPAPELGQLVQDLRLDQPCLTGGGWELPARLDAQVVATEPALRTALVEAVRSSRPCVAITADRRRAERVATALARAGLRAAVAVPGMRARRLSESYGSWRSRRLDALVGTPDTDLAAIGRIRPALLLTVDAPADLEEWHALVERSGATRAVIIWGPAAPKWMTALTANDRDVAELVLEHFGQPVGGDDD